MKANKAHDIFFSYSHEDKQIASELEVRLTNAGFSCFMSEKHLAVTAAWQGEIRDRIKASEYILLLITPRSKNSKWVLLEAGAAWILGKKLIPLLQFCSIDDLSEPIKASQARVIETPIQIDKLISELVSIASPNRNVNISFQDVLIGIDSVIEKMNKDRWNPDLIIGSGRGGAICAGIIGTRITKKALKVVDCQFKWKNKERITTIDTSCLKKKDIEGKQIFIVEAARQTGETYKLIEKALNCHKPSVIKSFALIFQENAPSKPDYFVYHLAYVPKPPWV